MFKRVQWLILIDECVLVHELLCLEVAVDAALPAHVLSVVKFILVLFLLISVIAFRLLINQMIVFIMSLLSESLWPLVEFMTGLGLESAVK